MRTTGGVMSRDDWKYYDEDMWDEEEKEEEKDKKIQCHHCTRYVDGESPYCSYCGRPLSRR